MVNDMKMLNCVKCGNSIPNDSAFCPFCGEKVVHHPVEVNNESANEVAVPADPTNIEAVLKRAFIFLEDGLFNKADRYLEIVLDQDPENAKAYVGKLLINLKLQKQEQLAKCSENFEDSRDFQKALRYADKELAEILNKYVNESKAFREVTRIEAIYSTCCQLMKSATTTDDFYKAARSFKQINGYKNVDELIEKCRENAETCKKESVYLKACAMSRNNDIASQKNAINLFEDVVDWKDSADRIERCKAKIEELKELVEKSKIFEAKMREEKRIEAEKRKKRNKKIVILMATASSVVITLIIFFSTVLTKVCVSPNDNRCGYTLGGGTYFIWDTVTIKAVPGDRHVFVSWNDGETSPTRKIDVGLKDVEYIASFAKRSYYIDVKPNNDKYGVVIGEGEYEYQSSIKVIAQAKPGYHFVEWSDGVTDSTRHLKNISKDIELTAIFEPDKHTVQVFSRNEKYGTVFGSGLYSYGSNATIIAVPKQGFKFTGWSDGVTSSKRIITISEDIKLFATFSAIPVSTSVGVARIGSNYYDTLEEAVSRAKSGDIINLLSNITLSDCLYIFDKSITIEGNGFSITQAENDAVITFINTTYPANDLVLRNILIENIWSGTEDQRYNRCIWVGGTYANIVIENCSLSVDNNIGSGQVICITSLNSRNEDLGSTSYSRKKIEIVNSEIKSNNIGIALFDNVRITIKDNTIIKAKDIAWCIYKGEDGEKSIVSSDETMILVSN